MRARLWFALVVDVCVWQISLWILDVEGGELDVLEGCCFLLTVSLYVLLRLYLETSVGSLELAVRLHSF